MLLIICLLLKGAIAPFFLHFKTRCAMKFFLQYDYSEILKELLFDVFDMLQPKIAYGKYIQVVRKKDTTGTYKAIIDYYLLDEDIQEDLKDNPEGFELYQQDKDSLQTMLVDDVIKEMQEFIKGKEIDINI